MSKASRPCIRYSISFKQQVVRELEEGTSIIELRRRYNIKGGETIQKWIRKFGREHLLNKVIRVETMEDRDRLKQLEQENKKLKLALADAYMAKDCLEVLIGLANKEYKTDLKKSFGGQPQNGSAKNTR